ncbi:MAG: TetM/TetW/TetO/TetS family tetracycline resistance ribosomal protection protein [Eubacterium sp.]|nr:TetM/TetW/TetO/TetS family tetracycline resistance ribosomal protection protein [Eubacterium sp.]
MSKRTVGILAHVDAGKTTLSEAMLYTAGEIRNAGRVDHGDSFLDGNTLERNRGITIFSKTAEMSWNDAEFTLLDTPGHVDFSAEMERTLSVLDYALLVISAGDGVQSHTDTLWKLLERYQVPTFLFVNKMDLAIRRRSEITEYLKERFGNGCIDLEDKNTLEDALTLASEPLTEKLLSEGEIEDDDIREAIRAREVFPCYFGSALKIEGIDTLLSGMARYMEPAPAGEELAARVFKISRDDNGERLTFVRMTGGSLSVKEEIDGEKVHQIRIYSGLRYRTVDTAVAGDVCALTGLTKTRPGMGLGAAEDAAEELLEPYMTYRVLLPGEIDAHKALGNFRELAEEDPMLHVDWDSRAGCITVQIMGQVQLEVLARLAEDRFGYPVQFDAGRIVYKETLAPDSPPVEGVGHFEPLRHYAEVHLLLEPAERGSGLIFSTIANEDDLDRNWQRLILTHLAEKPHIGVLTGAPITDVKITLAAGRAHKKHTEGGDFRQATYRAVRNGLMKAETILLEPWLSFSIELPTESVGRAMSDIQKMHGRFSEPETRGIMSVLEGFAPASEMEGYPSQLASYTQGRGHMRCQVSGYEPCHDQEAVIERIGYDPLRDVENTADSVFCDHGGSMIVPWDEVEEHMSLPSVLDAGDLLSDEEQMAARAKEYTRQLASDAELMAIFERTYGPVKRHDLTAPGAARRRKPPKRPVSGDEDFVYKKKKTPQKTGPTYILIDGYNLIHAWPELAELSQIEFGAARDRLVDILCNYQGFTQYEVIVVFDAYKVKGGIGSQQKIRNIYVVYTKEAETADMYIEKVTHEIARRHKVRVVSSDGLEQLIILGHGAVRTSSREFVEEVRFVEESVLEAIRNY